VDLCKRALNHVWDEAHEEEPLRPPGEVLEEVDDALVGVARVESLRQRLRESAREKKPPARSVDSQSRQRKADRA
jgi:hypothetical protein